MPFIKRLQGRMTPKRIYSLCKLAQGGKYTKGEIKKLFEPESLLEADPGFDEMLNFAKSGDLIREVPEKIYCTLSEDEISTMEGFRKAINRTVFKDPERIFCKFTGWYMARGRKVFEDTKTDLMGDFYTEVTSTVSDKNEFNATNIDGWKTWVCFMGLGYLLNSTGGTIVIPNAAVRVLDCIEEYDDIEKDKSIPMRKFVDWLKIKCPELDYGYIFTENKGTGGVEQNHLSVALSSALRFLHDRKKIKLAVTPDSSDIWYLEYSNGHEISSRVTDICLGGR